MPDAWRCHHERILIRPPDPCASRRSPGNAEAGGHSHLRRQISADADTIWFYSGESQRGNVGAKGTANTNVAFEPDDVCAALGPQELWPPSVCAILYQMLFPD